MAYVITRKNGRSVKSEFDPSKVTFREARTNAHGGKLVGISYDGGPLHLQLPEMVCPFGTNTFTDEKTKVTKYSLDFSFRGMDENERLAKFHAQLEQLQDVIVDAAVANSATWLSMKTPSREVVEAFFHPILKKSVDKKTHEPDGKYPDTIKIKLNKDRSDPDAFECKTFGVDNSLIDEPLDTLIVKGTLATALLQPSFVWLASGRFGLSIKALQMRVKIPQRIGNTCVMLDDEEDLMAEDGHDTGEAVSMVDDDDGDDDEDEDGDEDEEDEPVKTPQAEDDDADSEAPPTPPPAPKKRAHRRGRRAAAAAE